MEKRISSACLHEIFVRHGQRATLVGLQRNFLRQHDVACDEMTFGRKTPTTRGRPAPSSSWMFIEVPWLIRYRFPLWQPVTSKYLFVLYCVNCSGDSHPFNSSRPRVSLSQYP